MQKVVNANKPQGVTPLEVIERMREVDLQCRHEKMTYAGRLDPMAEGVLLLLVGDAVHKKDVFLQLDKVYEVDVVFGFATDTHDLLGMVTECDGQSGALEGLAREVEAMRGTFEYPFPIYASKPVQGKPLFQWAREGRLAEVEVPMRTMIVYEAALLEEGAIKRDALASKLINAITKVRGDFRQDAIIDRWKQVLANAKNDAGYPTARISIHCASGTYVRTLVHELGKRLGMGATVMRLVRTQVGDHRIEDAIQFFKEQ